MDEIQEHLTSLENLLVKEFRACQALEALTREERQALSCSAIEDLLELIQKKEVVLKEMKDLGAWRCSLVQTISKMYGIPVEAPILSDVLEALPRETAGRLGRLREGILALLAGVRDLTNGNLAIAATALECSDAVQAFLLDLYRPIRDNRSTGLPPAPESLAAWDPVQRV